MIQYLYQAQEGPEMDTNNIPFRKLNDDERPSVEMVNAIRWRYYEGTSGAQIARETGLKPSYVNSVVRGGGAKRYDIAGGPIYEIHYDWPNETLVPIHDRYGEKRVQRILRRWPVEIG